MRQTVHSLRVSSQVTWPVRDLTSWYMCSVPPGPSAPPPFHKQMKRALSTPHASVVYSSQRLQRSNGSTTGGQRPEFVGHDPDRIGQVLARSVQSPLHGEVAIAPGVAVGRRQDRLLDEFGFAERQQNLTTHAALLTRFQEEQVAAGRRLRERQVVGTRPERVERLPDLLRGDRFLVGGKPRRLPARCIDHVTAEQDHLLRLPGALRPRELAERTIEHGDPGLHVLGMEPEIDQQLQLRAAGLEGEPVVLVLGDGVPVGAR